MITATLGGGSFKVDGNKVLLSYVPSDAGDTSDGKFDVDEWERQHTYLTMVPEANPRIAWEVAYRALRGEARRSGGMEWLERTAPWEPCPLPDSKARCEAVPAYLVPAVVMVDNGNSFRSKAVKEVCDAVF